jgi:hypothetical protein
MSKISLGQLDLLALQQYLEIVVGFRKKDDKAIDVQYVGEYEHPTVDDTDGATETEKSKVQASQVAIAALDEYGMPISYTDENGIITIPERQTVLNSLLLDGIRADEFLKRVESDTILTDVNEATYNMADDIRNIKDELYQLKNQLIKTGTIKDSNVYNGFIDAFIANNQKHTVSTGVKVTGVSGASIYVETIGDLHIDDYIVLENLEGQYNIQRIREIIGLTEIRVDPDYSLGQIEAYEGCIIKKSLGVNRSGKFVFASEPKSGLVETDETKFIVKDGISRIKVFELDHAGHGFGTEIKIPASLQDNVISKIHVSLAVKGNPGDIHGEFWKYDDISATFIKTEHKTTSIGPMEASGWFNNFTMELVTDMPVQPGERYILILESTAGSDADKWYIGGFSDDECLDDVHNDCYIQSNDLLYVSAEDTDMFLTLTTKKLEASDIKRLQYGLYTCDFDVRQSYATRIRVEMCINQEGLFKVTDSNSINLAHGKMSEIPLEPKGTKVFRDNVFDKGDHMVIGHEIGVVASCGNNNSNIIPRDDIYVANNADVYRVGYEIQAVVSNKVMEPAVNGVVARYRDVETYPLKFVGVVPGRDIIRPNQSSDRLLFECDFYNKDDIEDVKLKAFNHIQLQVKWHASEEIDNNILQANEELEGAIFDLTVSVDQAYTKDPIGEV